jgi:oligopeptide transport system substrate-binding protein
VLAFTLLVGGCFRNEEGERYYGKVSVPGAQEFRWSDGGLPRVFDPARAAAPPDTDAVRALFEGLTDYESGTLRPVPAVASGWDSSEGGRRWTFHLRADARWSNGDPVTAQDFVRSWQRTLRLGERAPHVKLLFNIEGAQSLTAGLSTAAQNGANPSDVAARGALTDERAAASATTTNQAPAPTPAPASTPTPAPFGVVAPDAYTLRVTLLRPDANFPALVAHPVFRPVHELSPGAELSELREEQKHEGSRGEALGIVTNGAFGLSRLADDSVELERAQSYWDAASVSLQRVLFVGKGDAEGALAAYRAGEVDAVTNAPVGPLAVKLLTPYKDFQRETFGALNYYRFNLAHAPFDDRRVREALAAALDIERLSADTLGGSTEPARRFLPVPAADEGAGGVDSRRDSSGDVAQPLEGGGEGVAGPLAHDVGRARRLLAEAGFPGGANFPRIRLLINRNEQQRLVAQAVARMWRDALGVETEIVVRNWEEYEASMRAGDYDVARRSMVMQTTDEETNMLALFADETQAEGAFVAPGATPQAAPSVTPAETVGGKDSESAAGTSRQAAVVSEAQALRELPAIPLHFASSYALVKPYVEGFESNLLDAPSLKNVRINTEWRPPSQPQAARFVGNGR